MNHHYRIKYKCDLIASEWNLLVNFCKDVVVFGEHSSYDADDDTFVVSGPEVGDDLVLRRLGASNVEKGFKDFRVQDIDDSIVATLMAASQIGLLTYWHTSCDTDVTRDGVNLYYKQCDHFFKEHGRKWWMGKSPAQAAADFHTKWKSLEGDVSLMAAAAQSLTVLTSARGGLAIVSILEELNEILMTHFDLPTRPLSEDLESVGVSGMLESWRGELFEIVVHGRI